jgi:hypothetical protein
MTIATFMPSRFACNAIITNSLTLDNLSRISPKADPERIQVLIEKAREMTSVVEERTDALFGTMSDAEVAGAIAYIFENYAETKAFIDARTKLRCKQIAAARARRDMLSKRKH